MKHEFLVYLFKQVAYCYCLLFLFRSYRIATNVIEKACVIIPKSARTMFQEWQDQRANKICTIEPDRVFKDEGIILFECARVD